MTALEETHIIATGPHGYGGAVQSLCRALHQLVQKGIICTYVALDKPVPLCKNPAWDIDYIPVTLIEGGAIGFHTAPVVDKHILVPEILAQTMADSASESTQQQIVLWGTYLFPYCRAALMAYDILQARGETRDVRLWLSPTGSDVHHIAPHIQDATRLLLQTPHADAIIVPSTTFADEIRADLGIQRPQTVIHPMIDAQRFVPPSAEKRLALREHFGFSADDLVMTTHSNFRPIKRPKDVLRIAEQVGRAIDRPAHLVMMGTERAPLREFAAATVQHTQVHWMGVVDNVEDYLGASDVELNCSAHDSFNLSLAEAMACAVPVVSTDLVGVASHIAAADGGFLFPYEPYELYEQNGIVGNRYPDAVAYIVKLADNEAMRVTIGERGTQHAHAHLRPEQLVDGYLTLLKT